MNTKARNPGIWGGVEGRKTMVSKNYITEESILTKIKCI